MNPIYEGSAIFYAGVNDHRIDLFEGQFPVPKGIAYNSYVIMDEKIAVFDTIEQSFTQEWLASLETILGGRTPDYLVLQHMEPDHSASVRDFLEQYPDTTVVGNKKTLTFLGQFFPGFTPAHVMTVNGGDTLELGTHSLTFVLAPMVHWPEVMMTYESSEQILFSADAFGRFGALDEAQDWTDEARRYYIGIVGKYGQQVQAVLKKTASLAIQTICPLHGPVLTGDLSPYISLYQTWSSYAPEEEAVCIAYTSVYGHTKEAVYALAGALETQDTTVYVFDLARDDMFEAIGRAFSCDRLVLATTTYNNDIFPFMRTYLDHLKERNFQNRKVALIENGSWAPQPVKVIKGILEDCKNVTVCEPAITIKSALTEANRSQIQELADLLAADMQ